MSTAAPPGAAGRPDRPAAMDAAATARRFRRVAGRFATGVVIVTSVADDVPVGMTVNAFTTVSLDPTLVLVCLRRGSRLLASIEGSRQFAATVLAAEQRDHARWFANRARPTGVAGFAGFLSRPAPATGCPLLDDGLAWFDCRVRELLPGGDHTIVLGEVLACGEHGHGDPLLFAGGAYRALDPRRPAVDRRPPEPAGTRPDGRGDHDDAAGAGADSSSGSARSTSASAWSVTTRR